MKTEGAEIGTNQPVRRDYFVSKLPLVVAYSTPSQEEHNLFLAFF
jgi:hypothetical protein